MAANEKSSTILASLAGRLLRDPDSATTHDIVALAACVLTQAADLNRGPSLPRLPKKPKRKPRKKSKLKRRRMIKD